MNEIELLFGVKIEEAHRKGELANILCNLALDAQHDTKVAESIRHTACMLDGMGWLSQPERVRTTA